ncbi:MAG: NAD(P)-dependent glycerol-3-phosphate dehydrogenase [Deltaproteobacteria bacterium]|nr:NAD(P)-dependent glycerol-3-phosphate dehydrogenase [Deltaproteobacteria bacterium]
MIERFTVLGAGSWGTTLADVLAQKAKVTLWARSSALCRSISEKSENETYLPGIKLSRNITPTDSLEEALSGAGLIVSAVPSHGLREIISRARPFIPAKAVIVSATKGIEETTGLTPHGIISDVLPRGEHGGIVVLSGPSFANEVARKLPAAVCAASESKDAADIVQKTFSTSYFRVYTNSDVIGVELGGALKNVIAIASGISDGLGLGNNARAALITRGLAEISRLGTRMGANPLTFSGLSGLGDLVLTCTAALSRNYTVGLEIGRGRKPGDITNSMRMVAEGVRTSKAAMELAASKGVDMPITGEVYNVLYKGRPPKDAVLELMTRELKGE